MLTATSNIGFSSGYQDQRIVLVKDANNSIAKGEEASENQKDKVSFSQKSRELQQVYEKKETVLEQNYSNETQRLENEFIQAKNVLEKEHAQKKQRLEIDLYV
ncbi:MAG: hypothetical protein KKF12_14305 [Proteobacteria bacterium]|nr:hypothetical protein [Desulfobacula sp.]MBU3954386.1 hypothetical protein [Pseudomonadota bacterium]MBU4131989.1 hypothetical protein [Pseudomonadota bacterium]